jgi:hypothetical protein
MKMKLYEIKKEQSPVDNETWIENAYNMKGQYIGDPKIAHYLCIKRSIEPEYRTPTSGICSIGFCEKEQKWYGWSHRAIFGFGIGDKVSKGDCAFVPRNINEAITAAVNFWSGENKESVSGNVVTTKEDGEHILVSWTYDDKVPNEKLRLTEQSIVCPIPIFGKGEWVAATLEDARQMACDFAQGVS